MQNKVRGVIFDAGGIVTSDVWEELFLNERDSLMTWLRLPKPKMMETGKKLYEEFAYTTGESNETWEMLEQRYWRRFIEEIESEVKTIPTIDELVAYSEQFIHDIQSEIMVLLLKTLKTRGIPFVMCSNNIEFWYQRWIKKTDFQFFFPDEVVLLSCRVGVSKSDPSGKMFTESLKKLDTHGKETIFFDDRKENIERAKQWNINGVLVSSERGAMEIKESLIEHSLVPKES